MKLLLFLAFALLCVADDEAPVQDYLSADTKAALTHFGLDWRALEKKATLPEEIVQIISAKGGQEMSLLQERRKKELYDEAKRIEAAYNTDMDNAQKVAKKVGKDAKKTLAHEQEEEKEDMEKMRAGERRHRSRMEQMLHVLQRKEEEIIAKEHDVKKRLAKEHDAEVKTMNKLWKELRSEDNGINRRGQRIVDVDEEAKHDVMESLAWTSKEQSYVLKSADYAKRLFAARKKKIDEKFNQEVDELSEWVERGGAGGILKAPRTNEA